MRLGFFVFPSNCIGYRVYIEMAFLLKITTTGGSPHGYIDYLSVQWKNNV